jgi:hypothetical protein
VDEILERAEIGLFANPWIRTELEARWRRRAAPDAAVPLAQARGGTL